MEKGMATHSSVLAWRIPTDRGAWQATVRGVAKSWIWLSTHTHTHTHPHTHSPSSPCSQAPHLPSWVASGKSCFLITLFGKLSLIQTPTHVRFSLSHPSIFWSEKSSLSGLHTQVHAKWAEAWRRSWRRDPAAHWTACTLVSTAPCWHWEVVAPPGFAFSSIHPPGVRASLTLATSAWISSLNSRHQYIQLCI